MVACHFGLLGFPGSRSIFFQRNSCIHFSTHAGQEPMLVCCWLCCKMHGSCKGLYYMITVILKQETVHCDSLSKQIVTRLPVLSRFVECEGLGNQKVVSVVTLPNSHFQHTSPRAFIKLTLSGRLYRRRNECTKSKKVLETPGPSPSLQCSEWGRCSPSVCQKRVDALGDCDYALRLLASLGFPCEFILRVAHMETGEIGRLLPYRHGQSAFGAVGVKLTLL